MTTHDQACRLTLLCHASTAAIRGAAFPADEPLDAFGERDCQDIGTSLTEDAATIWIAPERRTQQTAALIGLAGRIAEPLRDCDFGSWRGCALQDVMQRQPGDLQEWLSDAHARPGGGESDAGVLDRISGWMTALQGRPGRHVAITHPAVVRAALVFALGGGAAQMRHIDVPPLTSAGVVWNRQWRLHSLRPWSKREPPVVV